jgi:hypothetical protein
MMSTLALALPEALWLNYLLATEMQRGKGVDASR